MLNSDVGTSVLRELKDEIKKTYRKLAKIYHPDTSLVDNKKAEEIFQKINNAYEALRQKGVTK